jgi:hypothetical protein
MKKLIFIWVLLQLIACSKGGESPGSPDGVKPNTASIIPLAPNNLQTDSISSSLEVTRYVKLNWVDNSTNEDGFKIERKGLNDNFIQIATLKSNLTQYTDSMNLAPNTTYIYRVYSFNSKGSSLSYSNYDTLKTRIEISVGLSYGGGIIAYFFKPGDLGYINGMKHGFVSATQDQSVPQQKEIKTGFDFTCFSAWTYNSLLVGNTLTAVGSGALNTQNIIKSGSKVVASYYPYHEGAIRVCTNYSAGGYRDWVLPSKDELKILFINRNIIGGFASVTTPGTAINASYWSSSEYDLNYVWTQDFSSGVQTNETSKNRLFGVRAIRYF